MCGKSGLPGSDKGSGCCTLGSEGPPEVTGSKGGGGELNPSQRVLSPSVGQENGPILLGSSPGLRWSHQRALQAPHENSGRRSEAERMGVGVG